MEVALKENIHIVSGQFISANADNGQYYLNRYYFEVPKRVLERSNSVYVPG